MNRLRQLGLIGLIGAAIALLCYFAGAFHSLEYSSLDARFEIRGERDAPDDIAIVAIDEDTLTQLNVRFPFRRSLHGKMIDTLREDGAKQIAYDVQFTEQTKPKEDFALYDAAGRAGNVVFATTAVNEKGGHRVFGGEANLKRIGARAGFSAFDLDPEGAIRTVLDRERGLETFAVAAVEAAEGRQVDPSEFPDGKAWIDYHGPTGTFPTYSFIDVREGKVPAGELRGKTVIIGVTAATEQDFHPTPYDPALPGAEIQANAIATVADGAPLRSIPVGLDVLLILALVAAAVLLNIWLRPIGAFIDAIGIAGLYLVAAQVAFNSGWIVPVVYPLLGLTVTSVGALGAQYLAAAFERQRTRDVFARFVPEAVVGQVLDQAGEGLRLGGRRYDVTVLFSDIRGFTTFSESREPEEVISILNAYLSEMTEAILAHGGTLISFMGDGIMAVFGAPIAQEDHADRALAAAREMLGPRLEGFNRGMAEQGAGEAFRMGVGLNSGPVMAGQVGSERRLEYTTIGDTVNTASRLEGMTKGTPHQLFIAESTKERLRVGADDLIYVDQLTVRGRASALPVWSVAAAEPAAGASGESAVAETPAEPG